MEYGWLTASMILKTAGKALESLSYAKSAAMVEAVKSYARLLPRPRKGLGGAIRNCSFRITDLCNLRCATCGQWGDKGFLKDKDLAELRSREVPPGRYIELLRDLDRKNHRPAVYLWGGEPMLYRGVLDILDEAARLGMPSSIATNGTGVARASARLVSAPLFVVQLSIDGPDAGVHNACRPGASPSTDNFRVVDDALDMLVEEKKRQGRKLPLLVSLTTINSRNQDRLVDIYEAFSDRVDVMVFYLGWWIDETSAKAHTRDFHRRFGYEPTTHLGWIGDWMPSDYARLAGQLNEIRRMSCGMKEPAVVIMPPITREDQFRRYYTDHSARFGFDRCVSIFSAVEVNSNGDLSPCRDYHDYVVGNIKENTITELWNSTAYIKFRESLERDGLMPVCSRCCGLMGN